ncbi:hypothetical protein llap_21222 [Limosa lapponica baueri]|uniref:Uncharacterized protein n=1 Tax=Limosa lapponica baueri TaxID=1758121 RepID=A0A2I0T3U8_LIMLA|nr:hypothetical protein llap_21222 [Limosa lapponica baueri]
MVWGVSDADTPTVNEVANKVQQYEDSLSRTLSVATVEKLTEETEKKAEETKTMAKNTAKMTETIEKITKTIAEQNETIFQKLLEKLSKMGKESHSSPEQTQVAAIKKKCPPTRPIKEKQDPL